MLSPQMREKFQLHGMTVAEAIFKLKDCDPDAILMFACDYGDRGHTIQTLFVEDIEEYDINVIRESAYSKSGLALEEDDVDEEPADNDCETNRVVILQ